MKISVIGLLGVITAAVGVLTLTLSNDIITALISLGVIVSGTGGAIYTKLHEILEAIRGIDYETEQVKTVLKQRLRV
jgi:hypothetical protein